MCGWGIAICTFHVCKNEALGRYNYFHIAPVANGNCVFGCWCPDSFGKVVG